MSFRTVTCRTANTYDMQDPYPCIVVIISKAHDGLIDPRDIGRVGHRMPYSRPPQDTGQAYTLSSFFAIFCLENALASELLSNE